MENEITKKQFRPAVFALTMLLALSLALSAVPLTSAAAQNCQVRHTVAAGDTITYLANLYQVTWESIANANNLQPPYVITVGTVLCIPGGTAANDNDNGNANDNDNDNTNNRGGAPSLTVTPSFNSIFLTVENFTPKTSYYVRVFPRSTGVSYRIGNFTTNKEGDFSDWFRLPNYVPRTLDMGVCVKNVWTDAVSCVKFDDVAPFIEALTRIRCSQEGR